MASADQPTAPYLDAVIAYGFRGSTRFHVPGHKAGNGADLGVRTAIGWQTLKLDIPQDIHGVDLGDGVTPYARAEQLAAEAYGAAHSWFLTNGATQGNHALCLALAPLGAPVVVQRNAHASVIDGLVLSGGVPTWVPPEYEPELGMAHGVTPDSLRAALDVTPDARAAFIVSPTYYGMAADVAGCAEVAHAAGVPLVVDQSWGPHFGFHRDCRPTHCTGRRRDAHVGAQDRRLADAVGAPARIRLRPDRPRRRGADAAARALDVAVVAADAVAGRRAPPARAAWRGDFVDDDRRVAPHRRRDREIPGCRVVGDEEIGRPGVAGRDPLRLVIDVRRTGATGYAMAASLRSNFDTQVELATQATIVLVLGIDEQPRELERFIYDLTAIVERMERPGEIEEVTLPSGTFENEVVTAPREAFLGQSESVSVDDSSVASAPRRSPATHPASRCCCRASGSPTT